MRIVVRIIAIFFSPKILLSSSAAVRCLTVGRPTLDIQHSLPLLLTLLLLLRLPLQSTLLLFLLARKLLPRRTRTLTLLLLTLPL